MTGDCNWVLFFVHHQQKPNSLLENSPMSSNYANAMDVQYRVSRNTLMRNQPHDLRRKKSTSIESHVRHLFQEISINITSWVITFHSFSSIFFTLADLIAGLSCSISA